MSYFFHIPPLSNASFATKGYIAFHNFLYITPYYAEIEPIAATDLLALCPTSVVLTVTLTPLLGLVFPAYTR